MERKNGLLPERVRVSSSTIKLIADWWSELYVCGDSGATTWGVLDTISLEVTDCLSCDPPNESKAASLTAKAQMLLTGHVDF